MSTHYGPWATSIDACGNPQLSTFWRRRLTMLVPVSQTSPVLSCRNLFCLGAAALLMMVLPTVRFATAADKNEPATQSEIAKAKKPTDKASPTKETTPDKLQPNNASVGMYITYGSYTSENASEDFFLPTYIYSNLCQIDVRKELNITSDQEKKLREIARDHDKIGDDFRKRMKKEAKSLTPEEQIAMRRELRAKLAQDSKASRKKIEGLLTPEQLTELRSITIGGRGLAIIIHDPKICEKVGISESQKKELSSRLFEDKTQRERENSLAKALKENEEKFLAVITPKQWEQFERIVGDYPKSYPGPECEVVSSPDVRKQLALSDEQQTKLDAILVKSQSQTQELSKLCNKVNSDLPEKERAAKDAELNRKMKEMQERDRKQIELVLSKQQLAIFRQHCLHRAFQYALLSFGFNYGNDKPEFLSRINVSKEQLEELHRLHKESGRMIRQSYREVGKMALKMLSPQQQEKLIEELDRLSHPNATPEPTSDNKESGFTKVGVGTVTVTGPDEPAEKSEKKPAKPDSPQSPPKPEGVAK